MKKWLATLAVAATMGGSTLPAFADGTTDPSNDHAYLYGDNSIPTLNTPMSFSLNFYSPIGNLPSLTVQTSLGTLNGQGASITLSPTNGSYPKFTLSSTTSGTANLTVFESGVQIGSTQVTFPSGTLTNISVQASPTQVATGGSSTITITAVDQYGNPVSDLSSGTTFSISTTQGQLIPISGLNMRTSGANISNIATHNGVASAMLTKGVAGPATVTVTEINTLASPVLLNGTPTTSISIPITFSDPTSSTTSTGTKDISSVTVNPASDFYDVYGSGTLSSAVRELTLIGILNGYPDHTFKPANHIQRSEFAAIVTRYMGVSDLAKTLNGTQTSFGDVPADAWYDGAVAEVSALGFMKGDGYNFNPDQSISYAEVATVLLRNLGIPATGSWPSGPFTAAVQNGLFNGLSGSYSANAPATRGDVAIMVQNALHAAVQSTGIGGSGTGGFNQTRTLEAQTLGYTWYGGGAQPISVVGVPNGSTVLGNELQVTSGSQTYNLHLSNTIVLSGASSLADLAGKNIHYLVNSLGLVTYIEVQ